MHKIALEELLNRILCADSRELFLILDTVSERFSELFPENELLTFSAPGSDTEKQIELLQSAIRILSGLKK